MNMKKAIAAVLVVGTMTMAGAAFAGPRFHDRYGSSRAIRWEHQERHGGFHNNRHNRHEEMKQHHRSIHKNNYRPSYSPRHHGNHNGMRRWGR